MVFAPVTPKLTVDLLIRLEGEDRLVVIERHYPPHGHAFPGGFVDVGETLAHAAQREAKEETGLSVQQLSLFGCYSDPARDPRMHTVSAVYLATAQGEPVAADDAKTAQVMSLDAIPQLAFDHGYILRDYRHFLLTGQRPDGAL